MIDIVAKKDVKIQVHINEWVLKQCSFAALFSLLQLPIASVLVQS